MKKFCYTFWQQDSQEYENFINKRIILRTDSRSDSIFFLQVTLTLWLLLEEKENSYKNVFAIFVVIGLFFVGRKLLKNNLKIDGKLIKGIKYNEIFWRYMLTYLKVGKKSLDAKVGNKYW